MIRSRPWKEFDTPAERIAERRLQRVLNLQPAHRAVVAGGQAPAAGKREQASAGRRMQVAAGFAHQAVDPQWAGSMNAHPIIHDGDLVSYCASTREALHGAISAMYRIGSERIAAASPQRLDNSTGELVDRRYFLAFGEHVEDRTVLQNAFYWAAVLRQIAEQAPGGWTTDAWHEAFKRTELGYEQIRVNVAGRKRPTVYRRLKSTTDLTVKQMSEYLDRVIATASTDLGVVFVFREDEREAVRYRRPARAKKAQQVEAETA